MPSNGVSATIALCDLDLLFEGKKCKICIYLKRKELAQKFMGHICRFWHLSSNDVIAKIAFHDLDLLFEDQNSKILISLKLRASAKVHVTTFKDFDICQWYHCDSYK